MKKSLIKVPAAAGGNTPQYRKRRVLFCGLTALLLAGCGADSNPAATPAAQNTAELPSQVDRGPRVVGGSEVQHNDYPWMVAILESGAGNASAGQFCGGSLIAKRWVLTAAHCVENMQATDVDALIGRRVLTDNDGETIAVSRIVTHPDYAVYQYPDLALLELSSASAAPVVAMPSLNYPAPAVGESSIVTGWGQVSENGPPTNQLLETSLVISDHESCNRAYNGDIVETAMVCAGTSSGNDSCYGDSGGPLFVKRGSQFVQAGVVSFGEQCGLPSHPGVYARVASYYDWISSYADVLAYKGDFNGDDENTDDQTTDDSTDNDQTNDDQNSDDQNTDDQTDTTDNIDNVDPQTGEGFSVNCNGLTCSFQAQHGQLDYFWDFDDGEFDFGSKVEHQFMYPGSYVVYLGTIDEDGEFQDYEQTVRVGESESASVEGFKASYTGRLRGRGAQHDLPKNGEPVTLAAGELTATLNVPKNRKFRLYVDRYDPQTDEWYEEARATSKKGKINLQLPVQAGEYGFTVLSLSRGGRYELEVNLQPG